MKTYEDFVEIIEIDDYKQLINILQSSSPNFRKDYIFRGLGSTEYELIPSALRKDENDEYTITNYIDSKFSVYQPKSPSDHFKECRIPPETYSALSKKNHTILLNKYGQASDDNTKSLCWVSSDEELRFKRELYILLRFLNWTDKSGLKISTTPEIRKLIHENINYKPPQYKWPNFNFFEIISLAQHYELPTQAMDWSYDYKSSLYFATSNILEGNEDDCVLWAFNYKLFEDNYQPGHPFPYKLQFYRPEYSSNPNLRGQKGLFTFVISEEYNFDERPFDEIIIEDIIKNIRPEKKIENYISIYGLNDFIIPRNEKIFYKFIIPNELKHVILKELYLDGYSEENLFPGYRGVVQAIQNRVTLDEYIKELNTPKRINMIMSFDEDEIKSIFENEKRIIFKKKVYHTFLDNIFIYSKDTGKILGYFKGNNIIKNTPENMWNTFSEKSIFTKEKFIQYFENKNDGYGIIITNLTKIDYPIKLNLNLNSEFYYIHPNDKNLNYLLNFIK